MTHKNDHIKKIVLNGLMTGLVFLATSVIKIPTVNGYIHLGDGFIFISAIILGPFYGSFAAGVGSMLADLLSPYAQWAVPSLIIKSLMALIMGLVIRQKTKKQAIISAVTTVAIWSLFFIVIKDVLAKAIDFSIDNLSVDLEQTPENVMNAASDIQTKLTVAIIGIIIIVFAILIYLVKKQKTKTVGPGIVIGMLSSGACMVIGYYFAELILYGNPISPIFSVPLNIIQLIVGIAITISIAPALIKANRYYNGKAD
ncbi:MAG TPA: ECF transporter S component [Thermoclostridium sp.]|nr:ECF transporter S component [Thermoclostridium sp.]